MHHFCKGMGRLLSCMLSSLLNFCLKERGGIYESARPCITANRRRHNIDGHHCKNCIEEITIYDISHNEQDPILYQHILYLTRDGVVYEQRQEKTIVTTSIYFIISMGSYYEDCKPKPCFLFYSLSFTNSSSDHSNTTQK